MKKFSLLIALGVAFLALYPAAELTRAIFVFGIDTIARAEAIGAYIIWNTVGWTPTLSTFYTELSLIWGFWLAIPVVVYTAIQSAYKEGRRE